MFGGASPRTRAVPPPPFSASLKVASVEVDVMITSVSRSCTSAWHAAADLSFSLASHDPFVAVCIGENYMLVFGTTGSHTNEDVGLTFPDDYGPITGFQWLEDDVVLVSLANGYITSVDFGAMVRMRRQHGLPEAVKATGTDDAEIGRAHV